MKHSNTFSFRIKAENFKMGEENMKRLLIKFTGMFFYFVSPAIAVILLEYCIHNDLSMIVTTINTKRELYVLTYLITLIIQTFFVSIINNLYITLMFMQFLSAAVGVFSFYKLKFINEPLLPWDIYLVSQVFDLIPTLSNSINMKLVAVGLICVIVIIGVMIKFVKFNLLSWPRRIILFVATFIPIYMLGTYNQESNFWKAYFKEVGVSDTPWDQSLSLKHNGFVVNFISKIPALKVPEPENYSKKTVRDLAESIDATQTHEISDLKPNIVIIMSEAFWELERMIGQVGEESLYPTVLANSVGHTISFRHGGGTSNVEFEAMTGFSLNLLPPGTVPYQQFMKGDVPSLPRYLREYGYATTGLHTYFKYYWRRSLAYPSLGLDEFIGLDDLENPKYYGTYVDDEVMNDLIMEQLKEEDKPQFIYGITMQNHSSFEDNRYGEDTLQLTDAYSDRANKMINTYGTGITHSDAMLYELLNELAEFDEPTLVVFFGDHLPYLDQTYAETKFVEDNNNKTLEEQLKLKETPLVAWNNYGKEIDSVGSISTFYLAPKILEWAELAKPKYYQFTEAFSEKLPGYTNIVKMDGEGNLMVKTPEQYIELEKQFKLLQYDLFFGKRYSVEEMFKVDPQYK